MEDDWGNFKIEKTNPDNLIKENEHSLEDKQEKNHTKNSINKEKNMKTLSKEQSNDNDDIFGDSPSEDKKESP